MESLRAIGAADTLIGPPEPAYPFLDLATGERWVMRPNAGRVPWWLFDGARRVPGTRALDYLRALRIAVAGRHDPAIAALDRRAAIFHPLWRPPAAAAPNP